MFRSLLLLCLVPSLAYPCSSALFSKGATSEGATFMTYVADSHELYGDLHLTPAQQHGPGEVRVIIEWDTGKRLGEIPQVPRTFAVVGNMNEKQVSIGESTFTGREELRDPTGVIDYGTLMQLALERAASAREAVQVMTDLVAKYGYASTGESFSIADPSEVWLLEMVGKGPAVKGAVWVARKVPDGYLTAHANGSRIRTFPLHDKDTLYAKDVITFARGKGWFSGKDEDFSFADAYHPLTWDTLRFCEARVWSIFRRAAPSLKLPVELVTSTTGKERMPLWVKPDHALSTAEVMALMRDHFEGTPLDMTQGLGAGPSQTPYRWRPLTWDANGKKYLNERAISTQQTGFSIVTEARASLPDAIGGVQWFGVDDTASTVWVPIYAQVSRVPPSYAVGRADLLHFSWDSAFWVFNWVANQAYPRYSELIVDIQAAQHELEGDFLARQSTIEAAALERFKRSPEDAREYLTAYSVERGERTVKRWKQLGEDLLVKYVDGNLKDELGKTRHPGYSKAWYEAVARAEGEKLEVKHLPGEAKPVPVPVKGYFHSREELGPWASAVPKDFDFAAEKLVLLPGTDRCERPPRCCVTPKAGPEGLLVEPPQEEAKDPCGTPAWLIRVPKADARKLVQPAEDE